MNPIELGVVELNNCHPTLPQVRETLYLVHEVTQLGILINLDAISHDGGNYRGARAFHDCDIEDGIGVVGEWEA